MLLRTLRFLRTKTCEPTEELGGWLYAYEDGTECSETSTFKVQALENPPEESIRLYISVIKIIQFMLCGAEVAVCSQIHTK
jgi:hypothetical protein